MHEIYLLAVLSNASRPRAAELTLDERRRNEQAFYDRHSGDRWPLFRLRIGVAPVAVIAFGLALALTRLALR